jgi:hypothetical protein
MLTTFSQSTTEEMETFQAMNRQNYSTKEFLILWMRRIKIIVNPTVLMMTSTSSVQVAEVLLAIDELSKSLITL